MNPKTMILKQKRKSKETNLDQHTDIVPKILANLYLTNTILIKTRIMKAYSEYYLT